LVDQRRRRALVPGVAPLAGRWGEWFSDENGGVDEGAPCSFGPPSSATVIVPVALGRSSLVVERSTNGGRTWAIASQLERGLTAQAATAPEWFEALGPAEWLVLAPTEIFSTSDAGKHWAVTRSALELRTPAYFGSLSRGFVESSGFSQSFVQGSGFTAGWGTVDGGRQWSPEPVPASLYGAAAAQMGAPASIIASTGPQLLVAAGSAGLYISKDDGKAWAHTLGPELPVDRLDLISPDLAFVSTSGELLRSTDGASIWEPVLQAKGSSIVTRPRATVPAGGTVQANQGFSYWLPQSAASPVPGTLWLTSYDENFGGEAFASTADGGQHWPSRTCRDSRYRQGNR
jgi:hypothetical protein